VKPVERRRLLTERTFDATPEQLWDAWTMPPHVAKWWGACFDNLATHLGSKHIHRTV
jgi:uncharacterized protein YndB with AHSA1/START domain